MVKKKTILNKDILFISSYLIIYAFTQLFILKLFPFVHSDEAWLSGLTRNMLASSNLGSTETFFNLYTRQPHAIKTLFHIFQMPFCLLLGYEITSFRLMSLIFSVGCLIIFYRLLISLRISRIITLLTTILLSLNIQYIYASHMARQEIVILFFFLVAFLTYLKPRFNRLPSWFVLGCTIGLSIGIHPNSIIIAFTFGCLYLFDVINKDKSLKELFLLIITVSSFGLFFIIISLNMNPNFFMDYLSYGENLGVTNSFIDKLFGILSYYYKLFMCISGTYYVAPIKVELILFFVLFLGGIVYGYTKKNTLDLKLGICFLSINLAFILVGRYNATYIIFIFPFSFMLLARFLQAFGQDRKINRLMVLAFFIISFIFSLGKDSKEISQYKGYSYASYIEKIEQYINPSDQVLANLNIEYYFDNSRLLDYRNLAYLENESFEAYIRDNQITYIIYPEEMDYIYRNPQWQILYGEMTYYNDMKDYINNNCKEVGQFVDPLYSIRIVRYMMDYDWKVTIYRTDVP